MEKAVLRPAFVWTCPDCGSEHFERAIVKEGAPEDMQQLRDDEGIQPWEEGHFILAPAQVSCHRCDWTYNTQYAGRDNDEGDAQPLSS